MRRKGAVTPVVLTFNEDPNIARTLKALEWAERVVLVDSFSTDKTIEIARDFPNVALFFRQFDDHRLQWDFAIRSTGIKSEFVLALDSDMVVPPDLAAEIMAVAERGSVDGARIGFEYAIRGRRLRGSLYPSQIRLFRPACCVITLQGHTQVFSCNGTVGRLRHRLIHDDRKSLESWVSAQLKYSRLEKERLCAVQPPRGFRSFVRRRFWLTPLLVWMHAYVRSGGPFKGEAARRYSLERLIYEALLRYRIEDDHLASAVDDDLPEGHDRAT